MGGESMYHFSNRSYEHESLFLLNNTKVNQGHDHICEKFMSAYSIYKSTFNLNCKKSLNYLEYLEESEHTDIRKSQGTLYLYLWLYDKELKNVKNKGKHIDLYNNLLELCFEYISYNIGTIYQSNVRADNFEILKNLYDLYYKFDKIKYDNDCENTKYKCAKNCFDLYKEYIEDCNKKFNDDFCNELENFRNQFNRYISSEPECKDKDLYIPKNTYTRKSVIPLISLVTVLSVPTFFFILYKLTPFGAWFRDRSKGNKKNYSNIANEEPENLHASRISRMSDIKTYKISYMSK
uniref:Vir2 protein n=1 Tax=Plasmodium vivax TaxID=5855 RepID=Q9N8A3_PLAVI|nr:vir2 [Plasmodium vivax]